MTGTSQRITIIGIASAVVAVVGLVVVVATASMPVSFGFFESSTVPIGDLLSGEVLLLRRMTVIGGALSAVGFISAAFALGVRIGARRPTE